MTYEIEHVDSLGNHHFQDVEGHQVACQIARRLAVATGRRVVMRKAPPRQWKLLVADFETGELIESPHRLSKREAIQLWREWQAKQEGAVLVFWPQWAKWEVRIDRTT